MDSEIKAIIDKYQYDQNISVYNDRHFFNTSNNIFRRISSNKDIEIKENHVISRINTLKNASFDLVKDDIEDLERAIGEYEIAVKKVLQCYEHKDCNFNYSAEELNNLINKIFEFHEQVNVINLKRIYQD